MKSYSFSNFQLFENIPGFSVTSFTWIAEDSCKTSVLLVCKWLTYRTILPVVSASDLFSDIPGLSRNLT